MNHYSENGNIRTIENDDETARNEPNNVPKCSWAHFEGNSGTQKLFIGKMKCSSL